MDKSKSDLAFELIDGEVFTVAFLEGIPFVPRTNMPEDPYPEMVEIEGKPRRGFVL